ncbi:A disintegrin and metalloproteinase with thrombospondin motifs 20-like isoform X3 [Sciurus carolinensis]|uniref:A disintegrin and metalloproteinase with thrombospondin motifs 20-like isoform X3 n=1 Tax=Sciurus carolinensis TaxID=30640 RepID=UPI001FB3E313|nr:A disintegrin and metalloproteinase with thrombospondin motifs 20-like isoform X3 [Sciurus carolinensis]
MSGYSVVVKIPTGATNIEILLHSYSGKPEDDNHLALSDAQGNFLLNGGFVVSMLKEEINIQGALFEYSVSNNSIERINSTDRLEEELVLQCLVTYGKGSKQQQVCCQLNEDHLSDGFCNPSTKPESLRPCELHARAAWKVGSWRSCTATCGLGYQICAVKCVNKLVSAVLDDRECQGAIAQVIAVPMGKAAQWRHGSWTPCSVSCGRVNQVCSVSCPDALDGVAGESQCAHVSRPAEISVFALALVENGKQEIGHLFTLWNPQFVCVSVFYPGRCSRSHAGGLQCKVVVCQDENGQSASYCDAPSKPRSQNTVIGGLVLAGAMETGENSWAQDPWCAFCSSGCALQVLQGRKCLQTPVHLGIQASASLQKKHS